ncbi:MAG: hypothetical protein NC097_04840 [Clostridium sp.]|nr:hypothetical protein [Prevotella sp.]MCM1429104.1 hypothetical protein [Clostridium sp.]MCM1475367.1 hypothetical protein [Muribaculaceae bacterium]
MFDPDRESDKEDYFNSPAPEQKPKPPKQPEFKPDDPRYWDADETEWEHLKPRRRGRFYMWLILAGLVLGLVITIWLKWFSPAEEDASLAGYVEKISSKGMFFKTYEGTILPYREIMDTTRVYREDFKFTAENESVAIALKHMESRGYPVRVFYKVYRGVLPWRGDSKIIVTRVDSVDARKILPPEFRPEYIPERPYRKTRVAQPDTISGKKPSPKQEQKVSMTDNPKVDNPKASKPKADNQTKAVKNPLFKQ